MAFLQGFQAGRTLGNSIIQGYNQKKENEKTKADESKAKALFLNIEQGEGNSANGKLTEQGKALFFGKLGEYTPAQRQTFLDKFQIANLDTKDLTPYQKAQLEIENKKLGLKQTELDKKYSGKSGLTSKEQKELDNRKWDNTSKVTDKMRAEKKAQNQKLEEDLYTLKKLQTIMSDKNVKNNPNTQALLKYGLARLANGAGVLTDRDVSLVSGGAGIINGIIAEFAKGEKGVTLTPVQIANMKQTADILIKSAKQNISYRVQAIQDQINQINNNPNNKGQLNPIKLEDIVDSDLITIAKANPVKKGFISPAKANQSVTQAQTSPEVVQAKAEATQHQEATKEANAEAEIEFK